MPIIVPGPTGTYTETNSQGGTSTVTRSYSRSVTKNLVVSVSTNPGGNNPFHMDSVAITGGMVSGGYGEAIAHASFEDYPLMMYVYGTSAGASFGDGSPDVNSIFAATNPFRPQVLSLAFIAELKDLPKMIRDLGRLKLGKTPIYNNVKDIAKDWVGLNFGWKPLIGDLLSIIDVGLGLSNRQKEVDRLYSGSGLVRRLGLGRVSTSPWIWTEKPPGSIPWDTVIFHCDWYCDRWAVVRYRPSVDSQSGKPVRPPDTLQMRRILSGFTTDAAIASAWELLPWSWLIDYVYNVGSFLQSRSNGWRFELERACLMRHYTCKGESKAQSHSDQHGRAVSLSACEVTFETKTRTPIYPSALPSVRMPVLSGNQLSILGSLVTMRSRGLKIT